MKKICWIFSINVRGMAPFGYSTAMNLRQAKLFQEKIKSLLPAEIDTQFISYDISSNDIPAADLLVFNDMDSNYLSEEIKKQGIAVSFKDMVSGNTTVIKKTILNALNLGGI
ncbi:hypothetical protein [Enterococcus gallinarum]|uniref:hypothetical protein n=1 Tax=Enterococcus gallinarum TaxID=1353 RepID=UPI0012E14E37|nr:hypothetical protein [Enterococcus gallinarum]MUO34078.1 hypothetical protein [Enterococcus gallinarum]